ncbi:MAG: Osmotically-inducible protein [Planctomycetota bacterium]
MVGNAHLVSINNHTEECAMKTDSELKHDVENELKWEPSVNEAHIGVTAKNGIITLTGHVPTFAEKYGAVRATKRVYGVKGVADEMEVKLFSATKRADEEIAASCVSAMKSNTSVPDEKIKVTVTNGRVTLEGEVEWQYQREAAMNAIRFLPGVILITNQMTVKARVSPKDLLDKIKVAFHRSADIDARRITVEAVDGKVTLQGNVRSWAEKEEAQEVAWAAPGVMAVDNLIVVSP